MLRRRWPFGLCRCRGWLRVPHQRQARHLSVNNVAGTICSLEPLNYNRKENRSMRENALRHSSERERKRDNLAPRVNARQPPDGD